MLLRFALRAAAVALLAAAPFVGAATNGCQGARDAFWATWNAEGEGVTRDVLLALVDAKEACEPATAPTTGAEDMVGRALVSQCGVTYQETSEPVPVRLHGHFSVGDTTLADSHEVGWATARYNRPADYKEIDAMGSEWGVFATNQGRGSVTYMGVTIPLDEERGDVVLAEVGCLEPYDPRVCWGTGRGITTFADLGLLDVEARFYTCRWA